MSERNSANTFFHIVTGAVILVLFATTFWGGLAAVVLLYFVNKSYKENE